MTILILLLIPFTVFCLGTGLIIYCIDEHRKIHRRTNIRQKIFSPRRSESPKEEIPEKIIQIELEPDTESSSSDDFVHIDNSLP